MSSTMPQQISCADLTSGARPAGDTQVLGGGVIRGVDFSHWRPHWLSFRHAEKVVDGLLPRPFKRARVGREIPQFIDCTFDRFRCGKFDPGLTRFEGCTFTDVDVRMLMGVCSAHFENCTFSGRWVGNFDARPLPDDPAQQVAISGNSFENCEGFFFQGGVRRGANTLDPALHLSIWRGMPAWPEVKTLARRDAHLQVLMSSIEGRGPLDLAQNWAVVGRRKLGEELWQTLVEISGT